MGVELNTRTLFRTLISATVFATVFLLIGIVAVQVIQPESRFYSSVIVSGERMENLENEFRFDTNYLQQASALHAQSLRTLLTAKSSAKTLIGDLQGCDSQYPIFAEAEEGSSVVRFEVRCPLENPGEVNGNVSTFLDAQYFDSLDSSEIIWLYNLAPFEEVEQQIPTTLILIFFTVAGFLGGGFAGFFYKNIR
jgi:plasmid replication initiation protein